jgi:hypothetical protein
MTEPLTSQTNNPLLHESKFIKTRESIKRGRPKGSPNMKTMLKRIIEQKHRYNSNGESKSLTTLELMVMILLREAMKGNIKAINLRDRYFKSYLEPEATGGSGFIILPESVDTETWIKQMQEKNRKMALIGEKLLREMGK